MISSLSETVGVLVTARTMRLLGTAVLTGAKHRGVRVPPTAPI